MTTEQQLLDLWSVSPDIHDDRVAAFRTLCTDPVTISGITSRSPTSSPGLVLPVPVVAVWSTSPSGGLPRPAPSRPTY